MCWTQSIEARWGTVGERFSPFVSVFTAFLAQPIGQVSEFLAQGSNGRCRHDWARSVTLLPLACALKLWFSSTEQASVGCLSLLVSVWWAIDENNSPYPIDPKTLCLG